MIKIGIGKKIIFWCIWTVLLLEFFGVGGRVWAEKVVSFEQVSEKLEAMIREVQTKQSRISEKKLLMLQKKNSQEICHYRHDGDFIIMSPLCFLSSMKLDFDYKRAIDLVWNDIEGFEESYDMSAQEFEYQSTRPILSKQKNSIDMLYQKRLETKFLMNLL
ncbi:MAG TPA: hypothetical protein PKC14_03440, partial [Candidatus Absconditabacterales bacterium]|nr:hypothetical protein [Candidatus Absconditabacterales bacterium]